MKKYLFILSVLLISFSCWHETKVGSKRTAPIRQKPKTTVTYHFEKTKDWLAATTDSAQIKIALALNRTDKKNIVKMDSIMVASDMTGDIAYYLPFPLQLPSLSEVPKIIFFSYATQTFGAYEYGELVRTGPTNMGRKSDQTPTGLFFTNWKAEKTTSTFNDEWDLRWNFNIANKLGVGWHQYELPGYPASHSCLRLQESDAKYLYNWADQWVLKDEQNVLVKGTPVIVFGHYDFGAPKPWYQVVRNPKALDITAAAIQKQTTPFWAVIISQQRNRERYEAKP
ncbi:L,D-transpeptidase [Flavobacterium phycosphaerae]|uniref:L,D-transpeptidase n=1 Tax=Flavobacterium phycosphaerae TaxID=2697515 RepID=UPI001F3FA1AA|nr:L,D-transpeptidase [Flavobacterium phycosphaerae]